ncbi:MAG TPA: DUF6232 family protein [Cyclobacteriaceae bacterium]|nr:DUF6232 family protein [Cyclobacteriaceae bacterium]
MNAEKENVLYYTDGHSVTVTDSVFQVKRKWYRLNGITSHGFHIIPPVRMPGIAMLILGVLLLISGLMKIFPNDAMSTVTVFNQTLELNTLALLVGVVLLIPGIILLVIIRERYAVSITTAEGEKHVVVSKRKEYVSQIVNALNEAFFARIHSDGPEPKQQFTVSGR